ncbi:hypothetical protein Ocin01_15689 [Orchesella cincta]|uniref:Uncharacterized protein n=1 Tax=Orchesella cincta TaxID=48709 RepID=A0A1D2MDG2_ORCCI|nr:hypothetical protein Ocin01_15689 [Orchesella cincta]
MEVETDSQISSNSKLTISLISSLVLLVFLYPWLIAVSTIFFILGFSCLEHVDKFVKASISSGRFGTHAQAYFKDYLTLESIFGYHKNVKQEVTADPLSEYLQESQKSAQNLQQQDLRNATQGLLLSSSSYPSLSIPVVRSSSNKSSPEKIRSLESPRSLSAASSRRVSEDVPDLIIQHPRRKTPSPSKSSTAASTPSPSITLNPEIVALRADQDFKVPKRVDNAFGRLCTNILNYYISPSWAPYETRRQLRVCFKQLLTTVGESINRKLICSNTNSPTKFTREKLIPLFLFYADKTLKRGLTSEEPIISAAGRSRLVLKIRKFCRQIFEKFLNRDDRNCKLWRELCIAVLADGVLVNVINLGKDKLPELLEDLVTNYKKSRNSGQSRGNLHDDVILTEESHPPQEYQNPLDLTSKDELARISSENGIATNKTPMIDKAPFLLDSFLDPPYNLEKPDVIVSRWRPTLKDIVSETDLLYPLIQFMKHVGGQQSLAYLQGVLDDFPGDGDPYCRRMLELEYLPGFCRSSLLLETMGLSRVEMALEVGADPMSRRNSSTWQAGHARSASYGGPTSSFREFLKIEQGIVDGLPLTESGHQNSTPVPEQPQTGAASTTATLPGAVAIEPNLAFKRRPHLEMYIAKFLKSTTKSWKQYYDPLGNDSYELAKREGIDAKSYEEWDHSDVHSRVRIEATTSDIYDELVDLVTSSMRNCPIASPFLSGLANFLKPYLMPVFNDQLDQNLSEILSVDLLVSVVDLIASVFEEPSDESFSNGNCESQDVPTSSAHSSPANATQEDKDSHHHHASCTTCDQNIKSSIQSFLTYLLDSFIVKMIDLDYFVKSCRKNRDYIFLFFVDVLDVLVREIVEE